MNLRASKIGSARLVLSLRNIVSGGFERLLRDTGLPDIAENRNRRFGFGRAKSAFNRLPSRTFRRQIAVLGNLY
jgi:hypothetical protein